MSEYTGPERRRQVMHCQSEVLERMTSLEVRMATLVELKQRDHGDMLRMHQANQEMLGKFAVIIHGNGQPGLLTRIHDLETLIRMGRWVMGAAALFMIQQIMEFFMTLFRGGG